MCLLFKSFENIVEKEEIASNEQYLLFLQCFLPVNELSAIKKKKHEIVVCKLESITLFVWERIKWLVPFPPTLHHI